MLLQEQWLYGVERLSWKEGRQGCGRRHIDLFQGSTGIFLHKLRQLQPPMFFCIFMYNHSNSSQNVSTIYWVQVTQNLKYINPSKAHCEGTVLPHAPQYLKKLLFFEASQALPTGPSRISNITMKMSMEHWWKYERRNWSTWSKTCPTVTPFTKNIMWLPGLHLTLWCETVSINHFSYSMANFKTKVNLHYIHRFSLYLADNTVWLL